MNRWIQWEVLLKSKPLAEPFTFAARDAPNELPLIRRNIWPFSESKELSHPCSANPPSFTNSDYLPKGIS